MTLNMSVEYTGGQGLKKFNAMKALVRWADAVGPEVRDSLKDHTPVGQGANAGRMRDSIRYERETVSGGITILFTANVPYAKYVIDGTAPHEIRAKAARALHWSSPSGSHFAKVVHHPGTRPNDFVERTIVPLEPLIKQELSLILQEELGA